MVEPSTPLCGLMAATVMLAALRALSIGSRITRELCESEPEYDKRDIAVSTCLPVPRSKNNEVEIVKLSLTV